MLNGTTTRSPRWSDLHRGPDLLHHARELVAEGAAHPGVRHQPVEEMQVGAADAGAGDPQDDVVRVLMHCMGLSAHPVADKVLRTPSARISCRSPSQLELSGPGRGRNRRVGPDGRVARPALRRCTREAMCVRFTLHETDSSSALPRPWALGGGRRASRRPGLCFQWRPGHPHPVLVATGGTRRFPSARFGVTGPQDTLLLNASAETARAAGLPGTWRRRRAAVPADGFFDGGAGRGLPPALVPPLRGRAVPVRGAPGPRAAGPGSSSSPRPRTQRWGHCTIGMPGATSSRAGPSSGLARRTPPALGEPDAPLAAGRCPVRRTRPRTTTPGARRPSQRRIHLRLPLREDGAGEVVQHDGSRSRPPPRRGRSTSRRSRGRGRTRRRAGRRAPRARRRGRWGRRPSGPTFSRKALYESTSRRMPLRSTSVSAPSGSAGWSAAPGVPRTQWSGHSSCAPWGSSSVVYGCRPGVRGGEGDVARRVEVLRRHHGRERGREPRDGATTSSPPGTPSAPPGRKSCCRSTTSRASRAGRFAWAWKHSGIRVVSPRALG